MRVLVSTCLLGIASTYVGRPNSAWSDGFEHVFPAAVAAGICFIPVCPEQLGGLPTPRPPSELQAPALSVLQGNGRIVASTGTDVTAAFLRGADLTLQIATRFDVRLAVLKTRSPSCGVGEVYSGRFDRCLVSGDGLTTALLRQHGLHVLSDREFFERWHRVQNFSFLENL
ncbi:MAG TPA: DUF523 domain-containing protein [Candidatus Ozemobacteraceae bacterium]|nr:DUF523 domain-containing protein [Candidatus Ozemobacteraceae bacterium]